MSISVITALIVAGGLAFETRIFKASNLAKFIIKSVLRSNNLYLAFTNGFHKRTAFEKKGAERSMLYLQYVRNFNKLHYLMG